MRSAGRKALFLLALFMLGTCLGRTVMAEDAAGASRQRQFDEIKARLEALESQQQEALSKREKILQQIDQVRIWARRSGGGGKAA